MLHPLETHPVMEGYASNELIHNYNGVGWLAFSPVTTPGTDVLATQTVGATTYNAVVATTTGADCGNDFAADLMIPRRTWDGVASAMSSAMFFAGNDGVATITSEKSISPDTGAMSRTRLNGRSNSETLTAAEAPTNSSV